MFYSKEQLVEMSKVYFENNNIDHIHCTNDGNFFYPHMLHAAIHHEQSNKNNGVIMMIITKAEICPATEIENVPENVQEVKKAGRPKK